MPLEPRIFSQVVGQGHQSIVVCGGLSQTTANWRGLARAYDCLRWILFDARGCGKSEIGERPYAIDDHVKDLMRVLEEQALGEKPFLLGFSHGGRIALRAAARFPDAFKGLILVSVGSRPSPRRKALFDSWEACLKLGGIQAMAWAAIPNIVGPSILERFPDLEVMVKGMVARNREDGLVAMFEGIRTYPPVEDDAQLINLPALIMHGWLDSMVSSADSMNLLRWLKQGTKVDFPDCGHTIPLEESPHFFNIVRKFMGDVEDGSFEPIRPPGL